MAKKKLDVTLDDADSDPIDDAGWTEKHSKEQGFQNNKRLVRLMEAMSDGYMLPSEETSGCKKTFALWTDHQQSVAARYVKEKAKLEQLKHATPPSLDEKNIFIEKDSCTEMSELQIKSLLRNRKMTKVHDRTSADIFIVQNVHQPSQRIAWCCILSGSTLCTPAFLRSSGHAGIAVSYRKAVASHRRIWCSPDFVTKHSSVYEILRLKSREAGSNWTWLAGKERLLTLGAKRNAAGHGGEVVAFVTVKEQTSEDSQLHVWICQIEQGSDTQICSPTIFLIAHRTQTIASVEIFGGLSKIRSPETRISINVL